MRTADANTKEHAQIELLVSNAVERERARCANLLDHDTGSILLLAGEMTARELRTVKAVLGAIKTQIEKGYERK